MSGLFLLLTGLAFTGAAGVSEGDGPSTNAVASTALSPLVKDGRLDVEAAVNYFENLYRSKSSRSRVEMTVTKPRQTRSMTMDVWTKGENKALIVICDPPRELGTATLKVDKNLWNYLPRIKRTIRIPPSMMLGSWMGSDFTNDDLVKESSFREDYTYELAGRSEDPPGRSEDPPGWLIRFEAKPDMVGLWQRFDLVISRDGSLPLLARYYNRRGELARVITWDKITVLGGKRVPARMTLVPSDKEGQRTEMVYLDIAFDVEAAENTFSLAELERKR